MGEREGSVWADPCLGKVLKIFSEAFLGNGEGIDKGIRTMFGKRRCMWGRMPFDFLQAASSALSQLYLGAYFPDSSCR